MHQKLSHVRRGHNSTADKKSNSTHTRTHTHACYTIVKGRVGSEPEHTAVYHPVTWCLSEAWRCVSKLLVEVKGESIAAGAAYSGVTFKRRVRAVLSSSKEVCSVSVHESFGFNALPVAQRLSSGTGSGCSATYWLPREREIEREEEEEEMKHREGGREGGVERVCWWVTDTQRVRKGERDGEAKEERAFFSCFFFWAQFKTLRRERNLLWRGDYSEPHWHPACSLTRVCVRVCFPKREGLMESVGHWLESRPLSQQTDCALTVVHTSHKHIQMLQ